MMDQRIRESDYVMIPKPQRARMVVTLKVSEWFKILEYRRYRDEMNEKLRKK